MKADTKWRQEKTKTMKKWMKTRTNLKQESEEEYLRGRMALLESLSGKETKT